MPDMHCGIEVCRIKAKARRALRGRNTQIKIPQRGNTQMNQEERREKRKKDTQSAVIVVAVFFIVLAVLIGGIVFAVHKFVKPGVNKPEKNTESVTTEATEEPETTPVTEVSDPLMDQAMQIAAGMTLEQKVAQMFMITPDALTGVDGATMAGDSTKAAYTQYPVGGLIYMAKNLTGTDQTTQMLTNMKSYSQEIVGIPVFLGVDEEGGTVARIASNSAFGVTDVGNMSDVGATGDSQNAYNAGSTIGTYLNTLGFNMDFAPVADVPSFFLMTILSYCIFLSTHSTL